jgi:redox-sensitive bicupin YhaK (pirin superfamily)
MRTGDDQHGNHAFDGERARRSNYQPPSAYHWQTVSTKAARSEQTPRENSGRLSGVQLWVALPDMDRSVDPSFESLAQTPMIEGAWRHRSGRSVET